MSENGIMDETERETGSRYGWFYSEKDNRVWNPQEELKGAGPEIVGPDGEVEDRFIGKAQRKIGEGNATLWGRLGPVEIDGLTLTRNTKIFHNEREVWLQAVRIELIEEPEPEPRLVFRVVDKWPRTEETYPASRLLELREDGLLDSQKEVNDSLEEALQKYEDD